MCERERAIWEKEDRREEEEAFCIPIIPKPAERRLEGINSALLGRWHPSAHTQTHTLIHRFNGNYHRCRHQHGEPAPKCSAFLFSLSLVKMFNNTELFMASELPYMLTLPKYSTISNANTHCSCSDWIKVKTFNYPASSGTLEPSLSEQPEYQKLVLNMWLAACRIGCFLLRLLHARRLNIKNLSSVKCFFAVGTSLAVGGWGGEEGGLKIRSPLPKRRNC